MKSLFNWRTNTKIKHSIIFHPQYRPDIDGLRAVAVILVIGYHVFPNRLTGGLIGVDIFFVISGFLISSIIYGNLKLNSFSFIEFYSRRIRRIFPALITILLASFTLGYFFLTSEEYMQLGKHMAGGATFILNLILLNETGYFDNSAYTKPLLHIWSLAVEEQFYLLWPVLLWFICKRKVNLLTSSIFIIVISFILNIEMVSNKQASSFYLLQARFWEFLVGFFLSNLNLVGIKNWIDHIFNKHHNWPKLKLINNIQSLLGFLLVILGVFLIDNEKSFPGYWAILPTVGAALLIRAGPSAWFNHKILSSNFFVILGLISYPLYLWHWPILSFAKIFNSETLSLYIRIGVILISVLLAWLTYELIEKPIRYGKHSDSKTIFIFCLMIAVGILGYACFINKGFNFRSSLINKVKSGDIGEDEYNRYIVSNFYSCSSELLSQLKNKDIGRCIQSKKNGPIDLIILGDSHADHLFIGMAERLLNKNIASLYIEGSPFIHNQKYGNIFNYIIESKDIKTVILSAYWYANKKAALHSEEFRDELLLTSQKLTANKSVYIMEDVPNFPFDVGNCKFIRVSFVEPKCTENIRYINTQIKTYYSDFKYIENEVPALNFVRLTEFFCTEHSCSMDRFASVLYRDHSHLNIVGSRYVGEKIIETWPELADKKN
ncbi:COG1835 Predicted acyltransferases [Methylophilaceae bacterium]